MVFGSEAFGRCLGHEGGTLMNGISALIKGTAERPLGPFGPVRTQQEMSHEPEGLSPDTESVGTLNLDFAACRIVGNKFLLLLSCPACGVLLRQPKQTETYGLNLSYQDT